MTAEKLISIHYPYMPAKYVAELTGLTDKQVYNRVSVMKLKKHPRFKYDQNRKLALIVGASGRFKTGSVPHNKGKKMSPELYAKTKPTMFKPGDKPLNTKPLHTINVRIDTRGTAYAYIKIQDSHWQLYHRYLYEQAHGPIPKGYIVAFKDGDTGNFALSNLHLITRIQNMAKNTVHQWPTAIQQVIKLKNKLIKTIKHNGKQSNK